MRPIVLICALLLGAASSVVVGCSSSNDKRLIAATSADALNSNLDALSTAVASGSCQDVRPALQQVRADVQGLSSSVDHDLKAEITQGYNKLLAKASAECTQIAERNIAKTASTESTPTTEATQPTTPSTEDTQPTVPTDTSTLPTTSTDPNGGVSPDQPTTATTPPAGITPPDGQGDNGDGG